MRHRQTRCTPFVATLALALLMGPAAGPAGAAGPGPWTIVTNDGRMITAPPAAGLGWAPGLPAAGEIAAADAPRYSFPSLPPVAGASGAESVIGLDGRTQVADTTAFPYLATASLLVDFPSGSGICTGWFISTDTLATAGHCVYDIEAGEWATAITVIPGRNGATAPVGTFPATMWASVNGWVSDHSWNFDYGAIRLGIGAGVGWYGYRRALASDDERLVRVTGYPGDKPDGTMWEMRGRIKEMTRRRFFYPIDTFGGQSGSPVYATTASGPFALGIHTYGAGNLPFRRYNSATRFTGDLLSTLAFWRDNAVW